MKRSEYEKYDAIGLAELVSRGEVTPGELLEAALERSVTVEPLVNAIARPLHEHARQQAQERLSGRFAGVPFLIKDLNQEYEGLPTSCGNRALSSVSAREHSAVVRRWLQAGLVIFGKTNTPEFGAKGVTEPEAFGPTRNPWDTSRTSGGSSGGSAAAVAAGIVPAAGASDGGGSIRIPAACCGLVGLKPGRGLVPHAPQRGEPMHGAVTDGVVSRTVRDTAAMLDVLAGSESSSPYRAAIPEGSYLEDSSQEPGRLRIGLSPHSSLNEKTHPEALAAVYAAAALLEDLGHRVEEAEPAYDDSELSRDFLATWFATMGALVHETREMAGATDADFEADTLIMAELAKGMSAVEYASSVERRHSYVRALADFHCRYDLLLTPTLARPPLHVGELDTPPALQALSRALVKLRGASLLRRAGLVDRLVQENLGWVPYTQLANVTGRPAISLPIYWTAEGLPLGVQLVSPLSGESMLLRLAAQVEKVRPWAERRPPLPSGRRDGIADGPNNKRQ